MHLLELHSLGAWRVRRAGLSGRARVAMGWPGRSHHPAARVQSLVSCGEYIVAFDDYAPSFCALVSQHERRGRNWSSAPGQIQHDDLPGGRRSASTHTRRHEDVALDHGEHRLRAITPAATLGVATSSAQSGVEDVGVDICRSGMGLIAPCRLRDRMALTAL